MRFRALILGAVGLTALGLCGCTNAPGRPGPGEMPVVPSEISDFSTLYEQNCSGCHGPGGKGGAAIALADPVYLAIADDTILRHAATNGITGRSMPNIFGGADPPPYSSSTPGVSARGSEVYATYCSSCHGTGGRGGQKASSIVEGSFLALVSDQGLRTIVIAGRPGLGAPDWRGNIPGSQ